MDKEIYNKYMKGLSFKYSYQQPEKNLTYYFGKMCEDGYNIEISWVENGLNYCVTMNIYNVNTYLTNKDWIITKTDLRKRKLELIRND